MGLKEEDELTDNNRSDNGDDHRDKSGRFTTGNPGKPAGSSKNKLRDDLKKFVSDNVGNLDTWMKDLKPKEKIEIIISLMPYLVPRLKHVEMNAVIEDNSFKKAFPFGGYINGKGQWVAVDEGSHYLDTKSENSREQISSLFPPDDELNSEETKEQNNL